MGIIDTYKTFLAEGYTVIDPISKPKYLPAEGEFRLKSNNKLVYFCSIHSMDDSTRDWALSRGATHWTISAEADPHDYTKLRAAKVGKASANIITDEGAHGEAIWTRLDIKQLKNYNR